MFCFWTYLSLFFVLQHSVSSDQGVSLKCSRTVEVTSGDTVKRKNCENKKGKFSWYEANNNNNLCDLEGNTSESDGQTYGSLTISDIQKNKIIKVAVYSVWYGDYRKEHKDDNNKEHKADEEKKNSTAVMWIVVAMVLVVFAAIIVLVILFFQFKIKQNKKLHKLDELHHKSMERFINF